MKPNMNEEVQSLRKKREEVIDRKRDVDAQLRGLRPIDFTRTKQELFSEGKVSEWSRVRDKMNDEREDLEDEREDLEDELHQIKSRLRELSEANGGVELPGDLPERLQRVDGNLDYSKALLEIIEKLDVVHKYLGIDD